MIRVFTKEDVANIYRAKGLYHAVLFAHFIYTRTGGEDAYALNFEDWLRVYFRYLRAIRN